MENLCSQTALAEKIGQDASILPWILARIQQKESPVTQNKQYAAEVLAIMLQSSIKNREKFIDLEGVDMLLQLLSQYRKRDPVKDSDEEEFVENLFGSLICLVEEPSGKDKFVVAEGIELAQIMLKESKFSKPRALRVLDHLFGGASGAPACEHLIEAAGLRTVFGMFMKKVIILSEKHQLGLLTINSKRDKISSICSEYLLRFSGSFLVGRPVVSALWPSLWKRNMRRSRSWSS